jgi:hypothetical protein
MEADVHRKNMAQGLDMSGTISSSPGTLSSSFISKSESHRVEARHGTSYTTETRLTKPTIAFQLSRALPDA